MAKSKKMLEITQTKTKANRQEIQINDMDYTTSAEPKAFADGRPFFCAHDKIVPIKELRENPLNPNKHPDDQIRALAAIIKATGWRQPITVSTRSGLIVKGHGRLAAAEKTGHTAYLMELTPGYTDVIVKRYFRITGNKAQIQLIRDGAPADPAVYAEIFDDVGISSEYKEGEYE